MRRPVKPAGELERARLAVRLLLIELLDETAAAGEIYRIARSVQTTLHEYEGGYDGADEDVHPTRSPQRELTVFADAVVRLLFEPAEPDPLRQDTPDQ